VEVKSLASAIGQEQNAGQQINLAAREDAIFGDLSLDVKVGLSLSRPLSQRAQSLKSPSDKASAEALLRLSGCGTRASILATRTRPSARADEDLCTGSQPFSNFLSVIHAGLTKLAGAKMFIHDNN